MAKTKTSISITSRTLEFLTREGRPTSEQIDRDANLLAEIFRMIDGDEGDCPLGRQIKSCKRLQDRNNN